jgi:hypothetical protein
MSDRPCRCKECPVPFIDKGKPFPHAKSRSLGQRGVVHVGILIVATPMDSAPFLHLDEIKDLLEVHDVQSHIRRFVFMRSVAKPACGDPIADFRVELSQIRRNGQACPPLYPRNVLGGDVPSRRVRPYLKTGPLKMFVNLSDQFNVHRRTPLL